MERTLVMFISPQECTVSTDFQNYVQKGQSQWSPYGNDVSNVNLSTGGNL